jgi:hypothetical protein
MATMPTGRAKPGMKERKPGRLSEISFRPADKGGAISETRTEYKRGGQGGGPDVDYDHETAVHPTIEHAVKHLKAKLGPAMGEPEPEPEPEETEE